MTGVRLPSRVVRRDIMRCLIVAIAAAMAATAGWGHFGILGAAKSKSPPKTEDPFLAEDTEAPAADEIPAIPDLEPAGRPAATPGAGRAARNSPTAKPAVGALEVPDDFDLKMPDVPAAGPGNKPDLEPGPMPESTPPMKAPRVGRDIRKTAAPRLGAEPEPDFDSDFTTKPPAKPKLPTLKNTPLENKAGWRPSDGEPGDVPGDLKKSTAGGPLAEQARLERAPELDTLNEPLVGIVIEGNKAIKNDDIMKLIKTRPGRVFDPKVAKEDVRTLVSKQWFFDVETRISRSKQGPVLVFRVRERPLVTKLTFTGNKKIKEKELKELADQNQLKVGGGYDMGTNKSFVHRILGVYQEKGYRHATVELVKGGSPEEREVEYKIVEGPKVVVSKISFAGNKYFSSPVLKTQVKTKTQILWLFGGKFEPASIPEDVNALRQYYLELGFFDVQIKHREIVSEDKARVHIEYVIEEGDRYKVRNVEFVGNRVIPEAKLRENMKVKSNQLYTHRFVMADREKIVAQYGELGRIFATIEPRHRSYEEPGYIDLVYDIKEDRPYKIGRIHVRINGDHPHTKETAVLTKLTFKPGELASMAKIEKSKQRLKNAQIFAGSRPGAAAGPMGGAPPEITLKPAEPRGPRHELNLARGQSDAPEEPRRPVRKAKATTEPDPAPTLFRGQAPTFYDGLPFSDSQDSPPGDDYVQQEPWGIVEPVVTVSETQTGRINLGVSVNSNAGLLASAVLEENNFDLFKPPRTFQEIIDGTAWRGSGQQLRVEAMPGIQLSRYLVSWRDPFFLEQDISFGVSGSYFSRVLPNWWERRGGGRVTVGRQFTPVLSASMTLRAENVEITNPSLPVPHDIAIALGDNFISTAKFSLVHDTRDSAFLPGHGHYIQADYEQGFGNFVYPKFDVEGKQYFLVRERPDGGNRHVISVVGQFGWTDNQTPFFERYYAGGFASFRGYRFYGVTPRVNGVAIGGRFQALGTVEYLLPITADNMLQVVTFSDFGTVDSQVTLDRFRATVGAGLRLSVPMMGPLPIAIDFAIPVVSQDSDIRQLVSFTMGLLK
ncbi:MAG: BamA/TamA family outer membrane protein [Planctomycetia bacterium]|nr:BamA/TamA family outer membrane protein [Planctomycetia bacterium]